MASNSADIEASGAPRVRVRERLLHVTWAWYMMTMSTGGVAALIGQQAHTFHGIRTIGKVVFIWDLILMVGVTSMISQRFIRQPGVFHRSLRSPSECLFLPSLLLGIGNIIICTQIYGGPSTGSWLSVAVRIVFWMYVAVSFITAVAIYLDLFTARLMTDDDIVPAWLLPILPIMLTGTIAATIANNQPAYQHMDILVGGAACQGLGFWVAVSMYGTFMTRMIKVGLPTPALRPGIFVSVAPAAYTSLAIVNLSQGIPRSATYFAEHLTAADTLQTVALGSAIFIWLLAAWWFCISLLSVLMAFGHVSFNLIWYSMIFPNVGFTLATISIGRALGSNAITWVGSAMTICLVATYLFILVMHARALFRGDVMWPGQDEDKET